MPLADGIETVEWPEIQAKRNAASHQAYLGC